MFLFAFAPWYSSTICLEYLFPVLLFLSSFAAVLFYFIGLLMPSGFYLGCLGFCGMCKVLILIYPSSLKLKFLSSILSSLMTALCFPMLCSSNISSVVSPSLPSRSLKVFFLLGLNCLFAGGSSSSCPDESLVPFGCSSSPAGCPGVASLT